MKYAYYPGCSLQETAREYDSSTRALMQSLDIKLQEIPGWTCCGASAAEAVDKDLALGLPARNLALAQKDLPSLPILVPCSACYLNLLKVQEKCQASNKTLEQINEILSREGLHYESQGQVLHLLQIFDEQVLDKIKEKIKIEFKKLQVAPYYGCQILRPYSRFDDPELPTSMDAVLQSVGAEIWPWNMGNKCCGASLLVTHRSTAVHDVSRILQAARGADVVVTVCPMCQMNLQACQNSSGLSSEEIPYILYLPQLLGLALGIGPEQLGLAPDFSL